MRFWVLLVFSWFLSYVVLLGSAQECGSQAGDALCSGGLCCSKYGWCGTSDEYCLEENGCQSQCKEKDTEGCDTDGGDTGGGDISGGLADILTREMFEEMLPYRNNPLCHAVGFYKYEAFIAAAKSFPAFATTGNDATKKKEVAAFMGQTSHETTGGPGWSPPGGADHWGYCFKEEVNQANYCKTSQQYPCVPGQQYYGRGPIQLSWNDNYGQCGAAIGQPLLQKPYLLACNATMSFEAALWFWMTPQSPKPSCHDVIINAWTPSSNDDAAGRVPGYGVITNIINGGEECGKGPNDAVKDRIAFYERYCGMLGVSPGDYLDCYSQTSWGSGLLVDSM
ncbi:hypothetical protein REPUB_Repub01dG0240300 [Reevesia pubescens]